MGRSRSRHARLDVESPSNGPQDWKCGSRAPEAITDPGGTAIHTGSAIPGGLPRRRRARMLPVLLSLGARLLTIAREPHLRAEGLTGLHQVEQHRHQLPRHGAHRADLGPSVPGEERLVLAPGEPPLLAPAARQEEELAPERRTPALRLP